MAISRSMRLIHLGVKNLLLHKLRSLLTMLGVVFGVASVVAMLAVGEGASKKALDQIKKLGSHNIIITAIKPTADAGSGTVRKRMSIYGLKYDDQKRIEATFKAVKETVPVKLLREQGRLGRRTMDLRVVGTTPNWFDLVRRPVIAGRVLNTHDMHGTGHPVVLTEDGARKLLATRNTIGQTLRIGGNSFQVVGIVRNAAGSNGVQTPDQAADAYIPITLAREIYGDISVKRSAGSTEREMVQLHELIVEVRTTPDVEPVAAGIHEMLERFHDQVDYKMSVPLALLRQAEETKRTFNIVLGSIAGISLLVGGIGIMNIMLASVTERTREIGIRRAIGATRRQIVQQFLIETLVLSTTGGLIGMILGVAIPSGIERFAGMPTVVTPQSLIFSVTISLAVGIIFGIYPAMRAAKLDPIVALRHE